MNQPLSLFTTVGLTVSAAPSLIDSDSSFLKGLISLSVISLQHLHLQEFKQSKKNPSDLLKQNAFLTTLGIYGVGQYHSDKSPIKQSQLGLKSALHGSARMMVSHDRSPSKVREH